MPVGFLTFCRRRAWLLIAVILGLFIASCVGLVVYWSRPGTTTEDVDRLIRQNLAPGATEDQIYQFLDAQQIQHAPPDIASALPQLADLPPDTPIIMATVPDVDNWPIGSTDIDIYFILREDRRLDSWRIKERVISL